MTSDRNVFFPVEPANDGDVAFIEAHVARDSVMGKIILRLRQEQEARKATDELCRSIRYNTIQECAAICADVAEQYAWSDSAPYRGAESCEDDILALLEQKP